MRVEGGVFAILTSTVTQKQLTVDSLTLGTTYDFTVEARNAQGYSQASEVFNILHALKPSKPNAPSLYNNGEQVIIVWTAPSDNGASISSYTIQIQQSDGVSYSLDTTNCDGTQATIV